MPKIIHSGYYVIICDKKFIPNFLFTELTIHFNAYGSQCWDILQTVRVLVAAAVWLCSMWNLTNMTAVILKEVSESDRICCLDVGIPAESYSYTKECHCKKTPPLQIFFVCIILNTKVSLMPHAKIQPNIQTGSEEEVGYVILADFSNGGHRGFFTIKF